MKIMKMLKRDMKQGTLRHWCRYLVIPVVVILMSSGLAAYVARLYADRAIGGEGTIVDYYLYIMQGMSIYHFSPESIFEIPITWFMLHIGMAYVTAYYPYQDFTEYGKTTLLAGASRTKWWLSKMLWCMISTLLYYVVIMLSCAIVALAYGAKAELSYSEDLLASLFGDAVFYTDGKELVLLAVVVPFLVSVMLLELQMLLGFLVTPVISFAISCGVYIVSAYYTCWWLPGSYTMWQRSSYISYEGVRPDSGLLLAGFGILCVAIVGTMYFREKDVL